MSFNNAKYFAIKNKAQSKFSNIPTSSGIYLWKRVDGDITYWYVGQAKNIRNRRIDYYLVQCGAVFDGRHFALSLKAHKDWEFSILEQTPIDKLNEREQFWIKEYLSKPFHITRNKTIGGQGETKGLGDRRQKSLAKQKNMFRDKVLRDLYKTTTKLKVEQTDTFMRFTVLFKKDGSPTVASKKALEFLKHFLLDNK